MALAWSDLFRDPGSLLNTVSKAVVVDLNGSQSPYHRNPRYRTVEPVIGHMRVPVRDLVYKEVQDYSKEERRCQAGADQYHERYVMHCEQ